jgi:hypothetical protein
MNGAYNMPVFGRILSTAETENLLDFLSTRKKFGFAIGKQQSGNFRELPGNLRDAQWQNKLPIFEKMTWERSINPS